MIPIFLILQSGSTTPEAVLARYAAFANAHPELEVRYSATRGKSRAEGFVRFHRNKRLLFECNYKGDKYVLSVTEAGAREYDVATKTYDEYPFPGVIEVSGSHISGLQGVIPSFMLSADLRRAVPSKAKFKLDPPPAGGGDQISSDFQTMMGKGHVDIVVDPTGRIQKWHSVSEAQMGPKIESTWTFSGYKPSANLPLSAFVRDLPLGFTPYSIPRLLPSVAVGQPAPNGKWIDHAGKSTNLSAEIAGRPKLLALLGSDCVPSSQALASLDALRAKVGVVRLTNATTRAEAAKLGSDALFDPNGRSFKQFATPATPMFFLVDRTGKVVNAWMGFDAADPKAFEDQVSTAVDKLAPGSKD